MSGEPLFAIVPGPEAIPQSDGHLDAHLHGNLAKCIYVDFSRSIPSNVAGEIFAREQLSCRK